MLTHHLVDEMGWQELTLDDGIVVLIIFIIARGFSFFELLELIGEHIDIFAFFLQLFLHFADDIFEE